MVHRDGASRPRRLRPGVDPHPLRQAPLHPVDAGARPSGERVYLWCRAGTSAADFSSASKLLAAACMAKDIKVSQHARYAHLIALDVIRREAPAEWNGHPWYDTGTPSGSPTIPAPREPADDDFWLGEPPGEEPRWVRV